LRPPVPRSPSTASRPRLMRPKARENRNGFSRRSVTPSISARGRNVGPHHSQRAQRIALGLARMPLPPTCS